MRQNTAVQLIGGASGQSELGDVLPPALPRTVLAERKSIRQSEFYQAAAAGLRPERLFVVWSREYRGERLLEHDGRRFTIIRSYDRGDERTELVCQGLVNQA